MISAMTTLLLILIISIILIFKYVLFPYFVFNGINNLIPEKSSIIHL